MNNTKKKRGWGGKLVIKVSEMTKKCFTGRTTDAGSMAESELRVALKAQRIRHWPWGSSSSSSGGDVNVSSVSHLTSHMDGDNKLALHTDTHVHINLSQGQHDARVAMWNMTRLLNSMLLKWFIRMGYWNQKYKIQLTNLHMETHWKHRKTGR